MPSFTDPSVASRSLIIFFIRGSRPKERDRAETRDGRSHVATVNGHARIGGPICSTLVFSVDVINRRCATCTLRDRCECAPASCRARNMLADDSSDHAVIPLNKRANVSPFLPISNTRTAFSTQDICIATSAQSEASSSRRFLASSSIANERGASLEN